MGEGLKNVMGNKHYRVLGLMSGTSLDAIDIAEVETDGAAYFKALSFSTHPMDEFLRRDLSALMQRAASVNWQTDPDLDRLSQRVTQAHIDAIRAGARDRAIDLIGFHGQTVWHDPKHGMTVQLGDGQLMAASLAVDVVDQFRVADVAAGGQGAPLVPLFHAALCVDMEKPVAIVNIGGVANVTLLGAKRGSEAVDRDIVAFDTGPGNALINDWMMAQRDEPYDADGACAASGRIHHEVLAQWMMHPYFKRPAPKSLDRNQLSVLDACKNLSAADGAATLTAYTIETIVLALRSVADMSEVIVCGGGRHNATMMNGIRQRLAIPVRDCDVLGWDGDALEAQAFAWLAVRSLNGAVLSLPSTTGVARPMTGGVLHRA